MGKTPGPFKGQNINALEFWALIFALKLLYRQSWDGHKVEVWCDNDTTVSVIKGGYSNKEAILFPLNRFKLSTYDRLSN